jgi:hypothetical protein
LRLDRTIAAGENPEREGRLEVSDVVIANRLAHYVLPGQDPCL